MNARAVLIINRVYCFATTIFYVALAVAIWVTQWQLVRQTANFYGQIGEGAIRSVILSIGIYAIIMSALTLYLAFAPRTRFWYGMHTLNHVAGIIKCCFAPIAIPLLVLWLRPSVRELFTDEPNG